MQNSNTRRFIEVMAGLFLIIVGFASMTSFQGLSVIMALAGFYLLARQFDQSRRAMSGSVPSYDYDYDDDDDDDEMYQRRPPRRVRERDESRPDRPQVYQHALQAVRRAGQDPGEVPVLPVDIGLMVFREDRDPIIHRMRPVPDSTDYVQPFVELRLPQKAVGRVKFEILNAEGDRLFVHEDMHELERGRNLLTPAARLAVHEEHGLEDDWTLQVSADDVVIAQHEFQWRETASRQVRRNLSEDGELSGELRAMMMDNRLQRMSLDDLLADQEVEDEQEQQQQSRSQQQ